MPPDVEGIELYSEDEAHSEALAAARIRACDLVLNDQPISGCMFDISTADRAIIETVFLEEVIRFDD